MSTQPASTLAQAGSGHWECPLYEEGSNEGEYGLLIPTWEEINCLFYWPCPSYILSTFHVPLVPSHHLNLSHSFFQSIVYLHFFYFIHIIQGPFYLTRMLKDLSFMSLPIILLSQALNGLSIERSALNSRLALTLYFNIN